MVHFKKVKPKLLLLFVSLSASLACVTHAGNLVRTEDATVQGERVATSRLWLEVRTSNRPTARHESSFVTVGGRGYLFGGRGERPLETFDPGLGVWTAAASPPIELHHAQAVGVGDRIYVVDGLTGSFPEESPLEHVLIYDPQQNKWIIGAEIPASRRRGASGVAVYDGIIYIVGGNTRGHNSGYVAWLDAFDPATNEWKSLSDAPHARDHFQAVAYEGKIYAAGGRRSSYNTGEPLSLTVPELDIFDIATATWASASAPLPTPRAGTAAAVLDGAVVVLGGESGRQIEAHREVEGYDIETGQWSAWPQLPVGRHGVQVAVIDGKLHVVAGSLNRGGGPELNDHWVFERP